MKIRKATRNDIESISELATKTFVDAFGYTFTSVKLKERLEKTRSVTFYKQVIDKDTILLAEEDDQLIGYVQFGDVTFKMDGISKEDQELQRVYVRINYQGKGVGKTLIEAALTDTRLKNAKNIYLDVWKDNVRARKLYRSFGFVELGEIDDDIIMVKKSIQSDE